MTFDDIKQYFGSSYNFNKKTGMSHVNFVNWQKKGYIPLCTQIKLQQLTANGLIADINDIREHYLAEQK